MFFFFFFITEVKFLLQILTNIFYAFYFRFYVYFYNQSISIIKKGEPHKTFKTITTRCLVVKFSCKTMFEKE